MTRVESNICIFLSIAKREGFPLVSRPEQALSDLNVPFISPVDDDTLLGQSESKFDHSRTTLLHARSSIRLKHCAEVGSSTN